ncbi:SRP9/SRP21 family protein [Aspergillus brunneoviolaceus CBS 621.78]|uniref:Uncharacterized protein n=1 Tax=Aspergillus brunneoviolaceus CBS 621.78 TaxID=1450534 RepID=A0ACD1GB51_9EURO|nr:hypothetical protein BO95DRAFT_495035 [Aspergillus brunneoviolaceus CBS 621.78]RAH46354.1 hypothetical protein BO95DRAFT_495035 [Aspergillus brunneoviolaceus CBS 621.78]
MPYLPTPQAYLEQSALLLQAYPDATKTKTKTTSSTSSPSASTTAQPAQETQQSPTPQSQEKPRIATLTLKTFHPGSGICLKYRTNKGAEVGRLISSLGKLAAGADDASVPAPVSSAVVGEGASEGVVSAAAAAAAAGAGAGGKSGKGKKKGGKGKR